MSVELGVSEFGGSVLLYLGRGQTGHGLLLVRVMKASLFPAALTQPEKYHTASCAT